MVGRLARHRKAWGEFLGRLTALSDTGPGAGPVTFEARSLLLETTMGKYFIAWLLGVPAFVLVLFYFLFN